MAEDPSPGCRSGALAREAGVSTDTLRHYERRGLLARPRRLSNGYREYGPDALPRVRLIQRALSVGFTLDELGRILKARARGAPPCRQVRALAADRLAEIDERIEDLEAFRDALRETLRVWDERLSRVGDGEAAHLLETLADSGPAGRGSPLAALRFDRRGAAAKHRASRLR